MLEPKEKGWKFEIINFKPPPREPPNKFYNVKRKIVSSFVVPGSQKGP
jgi:hypothetical protein